MVFWWLLIVCASMSSLVSPLNLPALTTQKPSRHPPRPVTSAPQEAAAVTASSLASTTPEATAKNTVTYRLKDRGTDKTCILMTTDGIVEVVYKLHGLDETASSLFSDDALVDGTCKEEDTAELKLSWKGFNVVFTFVKTMGGEMWYVSNVELTANVNLDKLHGIETTHKTIKLYNSHMLLLTPVGKSFTCADDVNIPLETDPEDNPPAGVRGSIMLRLLRVQPFMYKTEDFGDPFECKDASQFKDETAPIAVGSTLALVALGTVTGYGLYKYFKVKNVQYNTME